LLDLAETLIDKKTAPFDASEYHDRYVDALHELIERKIKSKGAKIKPEEEPAPTRGTNVVDLMAALKRSIERPGATTNKDDAKSSKAPAKKAPAKKAPAKPAAAKAAPRKRAAHG